MNKFRVFIFAAVAILLAAQCTGQTAYEMFRVSRPSTSTGIAYSTAPWRLTDGAASNANPILGELTVAGSFSDQQYTNVTGNNDNGLMFGVGSTQSIKQPTETAIYVGMTDVGSPSSSFYTSPGFTPGTGIDADYSPATALSIVNGGFSMFNSVEGIYKANNAAATDPNTSYYMGKVTYTFNRPVNNPVMHITGWGGQVTTNFGTGTFLTFSTEYELDGTSYSLQKVSGTDYLNVTQAPVAGMTSSNWKITNPFIYNENQPDALGTDYDYAGSGTIRVVGTNITSVTFKVYNRGKLADQRWSDDVQYVGDRHNVGWSVLEAANTPLPLTGVVLSAVLSNNNVTLDWKTQSEFNSQKFEIERSVDGVHFVKVGEKNAAGNSTTELRYNYLDPNMISNVYVYRLRMIDIDGKWTYSNQAVVRKNSIKSVRVFPNPVSDFTNIEFSNSKGGYKINIVNRVGQVVQNLTTDIVNNVQYVRINRHNLISGLYFINITNTSTGETITEKLIVN